MFVLNDTIYYVLVHTVLVHCTVQFGQHFYTGTCTVQFGQHFYTGTCTVRTTFLYRHLYSSDNISIQALVQFGQHFYTGTCTVRTTFLERHLYSSDNISIQALVQFRQHFYTGTCTVRTTFLYRHLYSSDNISIQALVQLGQHFFTGTCTLPYSSDNISILRCFFAFCLPVDRVGKVPVRRHKQITALGDLPARLVQLDGRRRVILLQPEAVGALALVEDVRGKLPAFLGRHPPRVKSPIS
jgi:hypothetical protein